MFPSSAAFDRLVDSCSRSALILSDASFSVPLAHFSTHLPSIVHASAIALYSAPTFMRRRYRSVQGLLMSSA